jgi:hypothetical protein
VKNANVFVDVDLTLIDADGRILDGAREALSLLKERGCHLFLWSTNGADYCCKVARLNGLEELFEGFVAKPDIVIDDMPNTCLAPFTYDVNAEPSWKQLAERILAKHVD